MKGNAVILHKNRFSPPRDRRTLSEAEMTSKMRIPFVALAAAVFIASAACGAFAADKPMVGYIDLEQVVKAHPILIKWNKDLESLKAARENQVKKQIKEKFGVTEKSQLTDSQRAQVQKFVMDENDKFTSEMEPKQNEKMKRVEKDIREVSAAIASEKKLDLVLDRAVVVYGGVDITKDVIEKIKKITK
jgi:outer membrane protein